MRASPRFFAIIYLLMGLGFMYIAYMSVEDTVWNIATIIFTLIAAFDFGAAIKMFGLHRRLKEQQEKK
ncbi:YdiK family protein [Allobacillus sp. GCM10007491]|uniref:YdiK family protein n=2 Tax=Allobacillus TaxID=1400133 RepID=A0A941CW60_9BACI|nr:MULTISPECIES: YdiK family protein [Allobacillus]MBR7554982.1 YdiK family protein [Allobacillus saliphilus]TSJ63565.1 DUF4305 domain-containing protein [Allobacillus salarius]